MLGIFSRIFQLKEHLFMALAQVTVRSSPVSADAEIVLGRMGSSDKKPQGRKSSYSKLFEMSAKQERFMGAARSAHFIAFAGKGKAEHVVFVGVGGEKDLSLERMRFAGATAQLKLLAEKCTSAFIAMEEFSELETDALSAEALAHAFAEGFLLSTYKYKKRKLEKKGDKPELTFETLTIVAKKGADALKKALKPLDPVLECVNVTRDWSNEPANTGTPEFYAREAVRLAKQYGLKARVLGVKECKKEKMELFLSVGQGSVNESKVVILEWAPKSAKRKIAFVGKGVTFDTGGISIKPGAKMEDMKHDMTGAATVMGTMLLCAAWKVPNHVYGVLAFAENMPSGNATVPSSVVRARNGKTVEIINTDAEGRLVLADVLDLIQDQKPEVVIDVATLTGAVGVALGKICAGLMGNDASLLAEFKRVADEAGERVWELPTYDEYFDDMKSAYADMMNVGPNGLGGTIRGAMFLKQFIRPGTKWAHLDIAYSSHDVGHLPYFPARGATGAHVRTFAKLAQEYGQ
jgi:leucyl aminopeptidase